MGSLDKDVAKLSGPVHRLSENYRLAVLFTPGTVGARRERVRLHDVHFHSCALACAVVSVAARPRVQGDAEGDAAHAAAPGALRVQAPLPPQTLRGLQEQGALLRAPTLLLRQGQERGQGHPLTLLPVCCLCRAGLLALINGVNVTLT